MNSITIILFISLLIRINGSYNPIPIGSVIISTVSQILVMKPEEYGGTNELKTIFTALPGMTIINTVYDPTARNLYVLFTNTTGGTSSTTTPPSNTNSTVTSDLTSMNNTSTSTSGTSTTDIIHATGNIYVCRLMSLEELDTIVYQLPIQFNTDNINKLNSFTSDIINSRGFLTDQTGTIRLFSLSGILETTITPPSGVTDPIRSAAYSNSLNQLYMITDKTVYSCFDLDKGNLTCCQSVVLLSQLRSITFDQTTGDLITYVLDAKSGIYQVELDSLGCPASLRLINTLGIYSNLHFVIDRGLYFASASSTNGDDNSFLVIANGTRLPRAISVGIPIVALHVSVPSTKIASASEETCFHGITYNDYRTAVILAAVFGTVMGIFMCFNVLFCIDFFMTKRIIRELKLQIPHNLLEDRWNRLVEEKYAKIALENQRRKDDPPPRRQSSLTGRKTSAAATAGGGEQISITDTLQVPNPIPKLSAFIRRKSDDYFNRRRSEDPRGQRQRQQGRPQFTEIGLEQQATTAPSQAHHETLHEENETRQGLRQNLSRRQLLQNDEDFL